ncbi:hypothetical protein PC120_g17903 [Phytophthora cactorum]|nr:hypothetical protein PC120_g17903 [Phytophthora cactorum]
MGKAMSRLMVNGMTVLALEDVGVDVSGEKSKEQKDLIKLLDKLYLVDEIKEQLTQLRNQMIVADCEGSGLPEVGHFVFHGSPGTVKTVARVITEILHELERLDGFGNGRDAGRVWKELLQCHAQRVFDSPEEKTRVKKKHEANDEAERDAGVSDENWEELERAKEAPAAHLEALKRARDQATREEERRRELEEERRRAAAIQEKIRQICPCPAGFKWYKSGSGWRCGGGSHFVWMHS